MQILSYTDLLVEFSPQSESDLPPGGERGRGGAEVTGGRRARDHTGGRLVTSGTAAQTPTLHRHLNVKKEDVSSIIYLRKAEILLNHALIDKSNIIFLLLHLW